MSNREKILKRKRDRAKAKRDDDPEEYRKQKKLRYYNEPGYKENVVRRIKERRLERPEYYLWQKAERRARKSGMEFNIDIGDIVIPNFCPVLDIPIGALRGKINGISLDRKDNSKGYIKDNVVVVSRRANTLKSNATSEELILLAAFYNNIKVDDIKKIIQNNIE